MVETDDYERKQKSRKDGLLDPWSPATETPRRVLEIAGMIPGGLIDDLSKSFHVVMWEDDDNAARYLLMFLPQRKCTFRLPTKISHLAIQRTFSLSLLSLSPNSNNLSSKKSPPPRHIISFKISQFRIPARPNSLALELVRTVEKKKKNRENAPRYR